MPSFLMGWPWWAYVLVLLPLWIGVKALGKDDQTSGKVVGIVGRMGSGKSYMATRIAYRRMLGGAKIVTNFSMHLECPESGHRRFRCPCKLAGQWQRFHDWPDLLPLSDAVVIIDEADLFAPSHDFNAITDEVRGKLKMARKYKLDIYWITQHENRMNRILREYLTNEIGVCRSFFGGKYFSVKFYETQDVRKKDKQTWRVGYFLNKKVAGLYDTLELIQGSAYAGDETMENYNKIMADEQTRRNRIKVNHSKRMKPCQHEKEKKDRAGTCKECHPNGDESLTKTPSILPLNELLYGDGMSAERGENGQNPYPIRQRRGPKARLQSSGFAAQ